MRFCILLLSSGSVTSLQSSLLVWCLEEEEDEELCFLELDEEWCFEDDDDPEGILVVRVISVSVSEPDLELLPELLCLLLEEEEVPGFCWVSAGNWACRGVTCSSASSTSSWGTSVVVIERSAIDVVTPPKSNEDMK